MTQTPRPPFAAMPAMRPIEGLPGREPHVGPRETSTLAVIAFVLSFFGTGLISFVMGLIALIRIPRRNQKGKGWAIAAMAISTVWTVRPEGLKVGDCLKTFAASDLSTAELVPCSGPNAGEVYAVFELPAEDWPGEVAVQTNGRKGCDDRWLASKRQADKPSELHIFYPAKTSWTLGDRGIICLLTPPM
jgi:hypothetical protein